MSLRTIVLGLDLSAPSRLAARWVANHFAPGAKMILVHCVETRWLSRFLDAAESGNLRERAAVHARDALEELVPTLEAEGAETVVREGRAAEVLMDVATEVEADLIAVGARRRPPVVAAVLGSTAAQLLEESRTPVLIPHGLPSMRPRRILAAIDESKLRGRVLEWSTELAGHLDLPGHVIYAVEPPGVDVSTTLFSSTDEYRRARARLLDGARTWLDRIIDEEGVDRDRFESSVVYGRPEFEIVSAAERLDVGLIVMGTRGRGRAHAVTVGSVALGVLGAAACPVLVIPPDRP